MLDDSARRERSRPMAEFERGRLAALYVEHAGDAVRLAFLLTGDRTLAEDLVQEAFARVVGRLGHLRSPEAFYPYLRRSVVNLSKNHFRHRAVERAYAWRADLPEETASPETSTVEHEAMREALMRLPVRQRAALVLHFYEDLPEDQVATVLRCRPGTVRSLVSRGVASLRRSVEVHDDA